VFQSGLQVEWGPDKRSQLNVNNVKIIRTSQAGMLDKISTNLAMENSAGMVLRAGSN
jgi:hypothetical protein